MSIPGLYHVAAAHTPAPRPPHPGPAHHSGGTGGGLLDSLTHSFVHGAGWSAGSRIMHALPLGVVILLVAVVAIVLVARRVRSDRSR